MTAHASCISKRHSEVGCVVLEIDHGRMVKTKAEVKGSRSSIESVGIGVMRGGWLRKCAVSTVLAVVNWTVFTSGMVSELVRDDVKWVVAHDLEIGIGC